MLLKRGSKGSDVKNLQEKLIALGYSVGSYGADGDFGKGTYDAVVKFQGDKGLDKDGIVGDGTWNALNNALSASNGLLKVGSKGESVKELQRLLISKGYNLGSAGADGDFGQGTYEAVMKFQGDNGLDQDGIVGQMTWNALRNSSKVSSNGELLRLGSKGERVRQLQQLLISKGYSLGQYGADGDFGQGTYNAVIKFQGDNGLIQDGIVGPATLEALNNSSTTNNYGDLLKIGSKGERVRELQSLLISKGYNLGEYGADGSFGQATYDAVVKFQGDHGLSQDGIVGPATWNALNNSSNWDTSVKGGSSVSKFIEVAKEELSKGFKERILSSGEGDNINPYGEWYGLNGEPWCAMFVSWCANKAGILGDVVPRYCLCSDGVSWYRARGRYRKKGTYEPVPGDVIFYATVSGFYRHTGIVIDYDSTTKMVTTIEGNLSQKVAKATLYLNGNNDIDGFGINGGPVTSIPSKESIYKQQSARSFAAMLGIEIMSELRVPVFSPVKNLEMYFAFSMSKQLGNSQGKIGIKNGKIDNIAFSGALGSAEVDFFKAKISSVSHILAKLGDAQLNFKINSISNRHFDIVLEAETTIINNIKAYQSLNLIFHKDSDDDDDSKLDLDAIKQGAIVAGVLIVAAVIISTAPELAPIFFAKLATS